MYYLIRIALAIDLAVLLGSFTVGCAIEAPAGDNLQELYPEEVETCRAEWAKVYGEAPALADVRVVMPENEKEYGKFCNAENTRSTGCYSQEYKAVVIRKSAEKWSRNLVTHEVMHALGLRTFGPGGGDADHHDPIIWSPEGILERVNAVLGLPRDTDF